MVYGMDLPANAALAYDNILIEAGSGTSKTPQWSGDSGFTVDYSIEPLGGGNMPAGISINSADGTITVASTAAVQPDTVYRVTAEGTGNWRGRRRAELQINVYRGNSLYYEFEPALVGQPYTLSHVNTTLTSASPANWEYFSSSPAMPDGLTLDSSSGEISGTPTKRQLAKEYTISAKRGGFLGNTHTTKVRLLIREKATDGTLAAMVNEEITAQGNNADLGLIDTSDVTSMSSLFKGKADFNGDISSWDVGNVTAMDNMFFLATSFNGDLSGWDVGSVTGMNYMFAAATSFNRDLSGWDVSSVTNMSDMFTGASAFNGDLSKWNVGNVTNMVGMFNAASTFNGDLSSWDVGSVTDMNYMFSGASAFNGDLSKWNVGNVTNMVGMFSGARAFNGDLSSWDVGSVTGMGYMFSGCQQRSTGTSLAGMWVA